MVPAAMPRCSANGEAGFVGHQMVKDITKTVGGHRTEFRGRTICAGSGSLISRKAVLVAIIGGKSMPSGFCIL
jgi:hypothetical protein